MRTRFALLLTGCVLSSSPAAAAEPDKQAVLWEKLRARVETVERGLDGVLGVSVLDIETGKSLEIRADESFPQASSIKWALLYALYRQAAVGRIDLTQAAPLARPRAAGSGILQFLGDDLRLSWRDLAVLMMGLSDNEATNLLIAKLGLAEVDRRMDELGLGKTRLRRRMLDLEAARRGEENVSTPAEMRALLMAIRGGKGLSAALTADLLAIAAIPKQSPFRRPLPEELRVADKPGELEGVRCVAAIVELPGRPYVAAIATTYLKRDEDGEQAVSQISAALFETFDRLARASPLGRVVSPR